MDERDLSKLLDEAAILRLSHLAVDDECGRILSDTAFWTSANRRAIRLWRWGVDYSDRGRLRSPESLEGMIAVHGVLRVGVGYVFVRPTGQPPRSASIRCASVARGAIVSAEHVQRASPP